MSFIVLLSLCTRFLKRNDPLQKKNLSGSLKVCGTSNVFSTVDFDNKTILQHNVDNYI